MYYLAIDQGTTGTTAALIDAKNYHFLDKVNLEFKQIYPQPSWVEQSLEDIWQTVQQSISQLLNKYNLQSKDIKAIGITNQRETTCAFDRKGNSLSNAIVWQDRRTHSYCQNLMSEDEKISLKQKTGLTLDPYFSASKMNWLLNNDQKVAIAHKKNDLLLGTIDAYLIYKLSGGESFKTDSSNASRTLLMDLSTGNWCRKLCQKFQVPMDLLPEINDSFGYMGKTKGLSFLDDGIPITGVLGDQQAALLGQAGHERGDIKCTYGTGAFVLMNTGDQCVYSEKELLTTVAYSQKGKLSYALEGSSYIAGAAVQWLRDNLELISSSSEVESLAQRASLQSCLGMSFFPFFSGIGSPHWKPMAKAAIIGLSRDSNKEQLARVCLEGICFSIKDLLKSFTQELNEDITHLKVDGGAVQNNLLLEMQANILSSNIIRPKVIETTALGAALAAAIGSEGMKLDQLKELWDKDKDFKPSTNLDEINYYKTKSQLWDSYLKRIYL